LQRNQIESKDFDLHALIEQLETQGVDFPVTLAAHLQKLSFLQTEVPDQGQHSYHFLHLTFQEFFAAKFLVQHLQAYLPVERAAVQAYGVQKGLSVLPMQYEVAAFIATHKHHPRYEIV
jgi:hypothetical protein